MIKAVIFDLDGTLCDTVVDLSNAVNFALKRHGYPTWTVEEVTRFIGNGITKLIERSLPAQVRSQERIMEIRAEFLVYYSQHCLDHTRAYDGIHDLLRDLSERHISMSVVTNKAQEQAQYIINALFSEIGFISVLGNQDGIPHKPDVTLTNQALKKMNVTAENAVFIGDSGVDMQTAKNAGMYRIGVTWGYDLTEGRAGTMVNDVDQLKKAILEL